MQAGWHWVCIVLEEPERGGFSTSSPKEDPVGSKTESRDTQETAREILRYLLSHPDAGDTLEGIARWWLERRRIERTVDEVGESLELLLARGLIVERRERTRLACYRMNIGKRTEIADFLK